MTENVTENPNADSPIQAMRKALEQADRVRALAARAEHLYMVHGVAVALEDALVRASQSVYLEPPYPSLTANEARCVLALREGIKELLRETDFIASKRDVHGLYLEAVRELTAARAEVRP